MRKIKSDAAFPVIYAQPGVANDFLHNGDFIGRHFYHKLFAIKQIKILYDKITYVMLQFGMTGRALR